MFFFSFIFLKYKSTKSLLELVARVCEGGKGCVGMDGHLRCFCRATKGEGEAGLALRRTSLPLSRADGVGPQFKNCLDGQKK